jgi:hypothetical protein
MYHDQPDTHPTYSRPKLTDDDTYASPKPWTAKASPMPSSSHPTGLCGCREAIIAPTVA